MPLDLFGSKPSPDGCVSPLQIAYRYNIYRVGFCAWPWHILGFFFRVCLTREGKGGEAPCRSFMRRVDGVSCFSQSLIAVKAAVKAAFFVVGILAISVFCDGVDIFACAFAVVRSPRRTNCLVDFFVWYTVRLCRAP